VRLIRLRLHIWVGRGSGREVRLKCHLGCEQLCGMSVIVGERCQGGQSAGQT
jgi:hypothetical protein